MNKRKRPVVSVFKLLLFIVSTGIIFSGCSSRSEKDKASGTVILVDRGEVVISVEATGLVEAENEVIVLSPWSSIIKKINAVPGAKVMSGDVVVELDPEPIEKEVEDIKDQLEVKKNTLVKTRLNNRSSVIDLDYNVEVKQLRITSLKSQLADEEQLLSVGGISPARLEETKQSITLAEKDLELVVEKNKIRLEQLKADEDGLLLQIRIQQKQLAARASLLGQMSVKAPSDGVLLAVYGKVGEKTSTDKMLFSMSDLTSFKISGSVGELYSEYIKTGNKVEVLIDNEKLAGIIGNKMPMVENNKIQFGVILENKNHPKLIANQAVRMQIARAVKNNALRMPENDGFTPGQEQVVFVKDSQKVVKKHVRFGMQGGGYMEILSGLEAGDRVILPSK